MNWQEIYGSWVLIPTRPVAIVHFLGGALVATAPHLTYRWLLEELAREGYVIIATPFVNTLDHIDIAQTVLHNFENTLDRLYATSALRRRYLSIYGLGHSMGAKIQLLIGSLFPIQRSGNILISFNNYAARDSIPLLEQISPVFEVEFTPSPLETQRIISKDYQVRRNLLIKFSLDTLDQTLPLSELLQQRFPDFITVRTLTGSHTTPLSQNLSWPKLGKDFTPLDVIGQWFKQEVYQDLYQLKKEIMKWLAPFSDRK